MRKRSSFEGMVKIIDMTTLDELKEQENKFYRKWQEARLKIQIKELMIKFEEKHKEEE